MIGLYLFILYEGYFWLLIRMVFDSDWFKMKTSDWIIDDSESVERKQNNNEQQIMTHVNDSYITHYLDCRRPTGSPTQIIKMYKTAHRKTPTLDLINLRGWTRMN